MWHARSIALGCALLLMGCPSGIPGLPSADSGIADSNPGACVDTQLCVRGDHWDANACACLPNAAGSGGDSSAAGGGGDNTAAGSGGRDAGAPRCVETQLCVRGDHWDASACACVPDSAADGGSGGGQDSDAGACIETQACIRGAHWDRSRCACVPDTAAGSGGGGAGGTDDAAAGSGGHAPCVDNVLCVRGKHWDPNACACVDDAQHGETCGQEQCSPQQHCCEVASATDGTCTPACETVCPERPCKAPQDAGTAQSCRAASDCSGVLPQLCAACVKPDGGAPSGSACAHWACKQGQCEVAICD